MIKPIVVAKRLTKTVRVAGQSAIQMAQGTPKPALLKQSFERLGATYIKLGQFIASTPSLFPKEYAEVFADCLDNTTPLDFAYIQTVLDHEFAALGGTQALFLSIDPTPLASASIAQVHKAVTKNGDVVVLKVQKPDAMTVIDTDLSVLHALFWALEKTVPALKAASLAPIVDEIRRRMAKETDFLAESAHLQHFHNFLTQSNNPSVTAPIVYPKLCTKKVLTMQFLDGISLLDTQALSAIKDPQAVMTSVINTWFLSLVATGEFHADLHAGNVLLLNDGRIGFLDFGLVGQIPPTKLNACLGLTQALAQADFASMAEAMIAIGMTQSTPNKKQLTQDLAHLFGGQIKHDNTLLLTLSETGKRHGIHFPKDFALLVKQLLYFDRFMLTLAPNVSLFDQALFDLSTN